MDRVGLVDLSRGAEAMESDSKSDDQLLQLGRRVHAKVGGQLP